MDIALPNGWRPRDYQLDAWRYLQGGGKHAELIWHRRAGKDDLCLHWAACAAHMRVANYWHMLPEYAQARKAIWDAVNAHTGKRRIDEAFPLELRESTDNQEMKIKFKIGSVWQVVGSDRYNSLVGAGTAGLVYSEWALANPSARSYLAPMIEENNGWQIFITTPRGRNHAYRTFSAARNKPGAFAQRLDALTTGRFDAERLEEIRYDYIANYGQEYGNALFDQEYLCSFDAAILGAIIGPAIGRSEQAGRIRPDVDYDPMGPEMHVFADIGRNDLTVFYFWQACIGGYRVFDHMSGWGMDAEEWADKLAERISQYSRRGYPTALGQIWLPHDARAKTFAAKRSAVETFILKFGSKHVNITPNSKKADRVNAARIVIDKVEFNSDRVYNGLEMLRNWQYEYDDEKKLFSAEPLHDQSSHDGDAFSYGALVMQELFKVDNVHELPRGITVGNNSVTLNELWDAKAPQQRKRI